MEKSVRDLEHDLALCEKATQGPWVIESKGNTVKSLSIPGVCHGMKPHANDAEFIAAAREALPYWLGEVKRLRELTDALGDEALGANAARLALSKILAVPCSEWPEYINDAAYILKDAIERVNCIIQSTVAKAAGERWRAMERVVEAARAYTCNPGNRLDHYHRLCAAVAAYEMEVVK